ncbi:nucleoprotein TPR [Lingula anatina]|uniref:Nucleoprotein TPR n=1 Tax=Lingula anatina TaxID=7574 RepID=A0A1S3HYA9_LINAN|nr:nucleoprotein TPR [Lingula anatina]|eukprot:XP_013390064.1 nucleoprotein TPR [Lingula anatina]
MAGHEHLSRTLELGEFQALPQNVADKLEATLRSLQENIEEYETRCEKLRVNSEQQYFEQEKELISTRGKLESETRICGEVKQQLADLDVKYAEASKKLKELETYKDTHDVQEQHLKRKSQQLEEDKKDLSELLEKRSGEIDRLNNELQSLTEQLTAANNAKCEALAKVDELQSQDVSSQFKMKRLEQERDQLQQQIQWLNGEVKQKTTELMNCRKERSTKHLELQSQLDQKTDEIQHLQQTLENLRKVNSEQTAKIENFIEKLKDARNSHAQMEEQYRHELQAQVKLVSLYKTSAEEAEAKVRELMTAVEEMQKLLKQAREAHEALEKERQVDAAKHGEMLTSKDETISKLQKELQHANELIKKQGVLSLSQQNIEAMSPTAAAASRLLKSGKTLTQIYSEYVETVDALQVEKEENRKLSEYLDQILQEIEEKAPIMKKQREDYEQALQSIDQLTRQMDGAMIECEKLRVNSEENSRKSAQLSRENQRYKQQTFDLGQQVRMLLKELEEARGNFVSTDRDQADVSSSEISSSSHIISEKLVTFKSIEELQEQNQRLLEIVRELSEKKEEEENAATSARTLELQKQLESAMEELEEMKAGRERQAQMVDSIVRQRDMYRVLLSQSGGQTMPSPRQMSTPGPSVLLSPALKSPDADSKGLEEARAALKELQREYEFYKKEKNETEKQLNEQIDKLKQEMSEMRVQNAKLSSQLDFSAERYKIVQSNVEGYRKEIAALRDKNQKYTASIVKHEQTLSTLREDLMAAQEGLTRSEVRCQNLESEKELLKTAEIRLMQEKEAMNREQRLQNVLLTNLQTIQNNLERQEFEMKTKLTNQNEALERECTILRRKIDSLLEEHRIDAKNWEQQLVKAQNRYDEEIKKSRKAQDDLIDTYANMHELKQELSQAEAKLAAAEIRLQSIGQDVPDAGSASSTPLPSGSAASKDEVRDLRAQLTQAQNEVKNLKDQLDKAKQHADQYRAISSDIEQSLKEQNEASHQFKEAVEVNLKEANQKVARLEKQVEALETERQQILNENIKITEDSHQLNAELRKKLAELQNELQEAVQRREEAIKNEQAAREDCQAQAKLAQECQEKYENELVLHAGDVETLTALRKQHESFNERLTSSQEEAKKAQDMLQTAKKSWEEQEKMFKEESSKLESRCTELDNQNRSLHEHIETMTAQMVALQKRERQGSSETDSATISDEINKTSEQLLEVIRFLRREKEIANTRFEVSQAESNRLKQRCDHLEKLLEETNRGLAEERANAQVNVQTAAQHSELMRKVENLNLLTDSNKLLREEKDRLTQSLRELETKVKKLEEIIGPLKQVKFDLMKERDSLLAEKTGIQAELDRWKARVNSLIEQANRSDPEEHKRVVRERDDLKKNITSVSEEMNKVRLERDDLKKHNAALNEETFKQRAEISRINAQFQQNQNAVKANTQQIDKLTKDLKTEKEAREKDIEEKNKTIVQLRKVGRKYKDQYAALSKEMEELKAKASEQQQQAQQAVQFSVTEEQLKAAEETARQQGAKVASLEKEKEEWHQLKQELENSMKSVNEQMQKLKEDLKTVQESETKLKKDWEESEKKNLRFQSVLQTSKTKLQQNKTEMDKLQSENKEMKEQLDLRNTEADAGGTAAKERVAALERELQEAKEKLQEASEKLAESQQNVKNKEKLEKENAELVMKLQQQQKMLESQQKGIKPSTGTAERNNTSSVEPPTANIRPMASPAPTTRQVVQPVSTATTVAAVQPVSTAAAAKAMASIRPMAITTQTPTATVMPVTQPEIHEEEPSGPVSAAIRPTQQVQPVSPHMEESVEAAEAPPEVEEVTEQEVSAAEVPSTSTVSSGSAAMPAAAAKRGRDQLGSQEEEERSISPHVKRTRTSPEAEEARVEPQAEQEVWGAASSESIQEPLQQVETQEEEQPQDEASKETLESAGSSKQDTTASSSLTEMLEEPTPPAAQDKSDDTLQRQQLIQQQQLMQQQRQKQQPAQVEEDDADIIIIVESEDEEQEEYDEEEEGEEEEEEEDYDEMEQIEAEAGSDYDEEFQEMEENGDEEMQQESVAAGDDEDIVIVEEEEPDAEMVDPGSQAGGQQRAEQQEAQVAPMGSGLQPAQSSTLQRSSGRAERLPSLGRNQLAPFGAAPGGGFEEGDDGIVPSTPTLFVPRRNDGFAEAVHSPMVQQGRSFVFGADMQQAELAQLATQGALGVDDTRMDLSAFDEGSGRSVPTTPLNLVPPVTIVTTPPDTEPQEVAAESSAATATTSAPAVTSSTSSTTQSTTTSVLTGEEQAETVQGETLEEENFEGEVGEEEVDAAEELLIGDQGEEDEADTEFASEDKSDQQSEAKSGEGGEESQEGDAGTGLSEEQKQQGKPKIKRITWGSTDSAPKPSTSGAPIPALGQRPPVGESRPIMGDNRGGISQRRLNIPRGGGQYQQQQQQPYRGGRGGHPQQYQHRGRGGMAQRSRGMPPRGGRGGLLRRPQQF